ncbi:MAG: hypothetical protein COA42_02165 [Alteromonadaceae bacterium]|nr:MAG: hypothetical protein COA42_02165 [Alteromonadaceae bacterium]
MKNKIMAITLAATVLMTAGCNEEVVKEEVPTELKVETLEQRVSYVIAYNTAKQLQAGDFVLDGAVMEKAVQDVNGGVEPPLTDEEMGATMQTFQVQLQERLQAEHAKSLEENSVKGQEFLADNGAKEGVVTTASGLQYKVVTAGTGAKPSETDKVTVNYAGTLVDGTKFDKGEKTSFVVNQLIPGWVEALPLMSVGSKWEIFVPSDLAYGSGGNGRIGPNQTLIFDMELLSVGE